MNIKRLAELATAIAEGEGNDLVVQVKTMRQVSADELVEHYEPVVDLCLSEDGIVLIRT